MVGRAPLHELGGELEADATGCFAVTVSEERAAGKEAAYRR